MSYSFMQIATVEVPEEYMGPVVELLGKRRGIMFDMQGAGFVTSIDLYMIFAFTFYMKSFKVYKTVCKVYP